MKSFLDIRNVVKRYVIGDHEVLALRNVSLKIEKGDFVAIMGPSGSGKSTLMHLIGLLDVPTSGEYFLKDEIVSSLSQDDLAMVRRDKIGFIFQQFNLLPRLPATENVALPLLYSDGRVDTARAIPLLEKVGLGARLMHTPRELSGGQQQRVAIARALIHGPELILADEPTGNLDSASEKEIMKLLHDLNAQGITVVLVTHEESIAEQAKRVIKMRDGQIVSDVRHFHINQGVTNDLPNHRSHHAINQKSQTNRIASTLAYAKQGLRSLQTSKIRAALSVLGILIGVAAVVAMLALGRGAQKAVEEQLASLGSNLLVLRPGAVRVAGISQEAGGATRLTLEDADAIRTKVFGIRSAAPAINGRGQLTYLGKNWNTQVLGVTSDYVRAHASDPTSGRFFSDDENKRRERVALIGTTILRELFDGKNPVGEMIRINRVAFRILGVLPEKGANTFRDQDDIVVVPIFTAMHRLLGKNYVDYIDIEANDPNLMSDIQKNVSELMLARHHIPENAARDAFQIRNMADVQEALSQSSRTLSLLLASIAAISLLVGGIGIMNIMLVSVTERTREIGLRKAVGAKGGDILIQFLSESVVLSGIGGILGVAFGWAVTTALSSIAGWNTSISFDSIFLAVFFSAAVGILFGIYPAKKASLLNPIEALRFE